ncbi:hypothetical protein ACSVH2_10165 [Flavobacterium sp. RSB2_4_14]|uniref:hypothetical protein n=1 Tax=Flavobacterium sp. RSB2_4_14 TaxID=3447665 RepID=UPI003F30A26F
MKIAKYLLPIFSVLFFGSCKRADAVPYYGIDFLFKEAQPINDNELKQLPNKFIGNYINQDSTFLIIEKRLIYYKWITKNNISFLEFDALKDSMKIVKNRIYHNNIFFEFRKLKDSVEITNTDYDTIFAISDSNKAKRIRGTIILNSKVSIYWKIKVLSLNNNDLKLMTLVSDEDLIRLDSLAKRKSLKIDSTKSVFNLSKPEFKKMLTLKKLGYIQEYNKLD